MTGIRGAVAGAEIVDPLRPVVEDIYRQVAARHGVPAAAEFILILVARLEQDDRSSAANVILLSR
jgi:hypothetical protein